MAAEHWRPTGLSQGYYCSRCGDPVGMYGHMNQKCPHNPELVKRLNELNTVEAEEKRNFLRALEHGN